MKKISSGKRCLNWINIMGKINFDKKLHPAKGGIKNFLMKFQWLGKYKTFPYHRKDLRKFGMTMAIAFFIITLLILIRHKHSILPTSVISGIFLVLAFALPSLLEPVYILWMKLAKVLSWVNTRLILSILFYLILTPMGLVMKLFGVDLLERKINKKQSSCWERKEKREFSPVNYEKQF